MASRLIRAAAALVAALWLGLAPAGAADPQPARIVAVGDLHGDYAAWLDIARAAGLIDGANHWAGGSTTLVQLGDIADRGPDTLKIIRNLQQLAREAPRRGGKVIVVLGNHEAMNVTGDLRYTTAGEYAAFADARSAGRRDAYFTANRDKIAADLRAAGKKFATDDELRAAWIARTPLGWVEHRAAWGPKGELNLWASRNPAIVKIGNFLFVHGGISAETASRPIADVNRDIAKAVASADEREDSLLNSPLGPLWYRGNISRDGDAEATRAETPGSHSRTPADEVAFVLSRYGASHLVVGHTPTKKGISILYDGKLARIDTAISRYYGGPLSWLEIVGDTMTPRTVARSSP